MVLEKVGEMLNKKNMPHNNQDMIAYAAGLFDGEGNVNYAQYNCKNHYEFKKPTDALSKKFPFFKLKKN